MNKKWSGSVVSAATETWINDMNPLPETNVSRYVSATLSRVSAKFLAFRPVSIMKMSSFPLEIVKNIYAVKSYNFLQSRRTRDRKKSSTAPDFRFAQISPPLWSFSRFWSNFIGIEVSNEEEYSILRILYCYSLQRHIFLAFCNDFDTHTIAYSHIFFSETKHCYSRSDVRSQLVPFSAIPRSST